jgi:hypothetical protein
MTSSSRNRDGRCFDSRRTDSDRPVADVVASFDGDHPSSEP